MSEEVVGQGSAEDATVATDRPPEPADHPDAELRVAAVEARIRKLQGHLAVAEAALAQARADAEGAE